MHQFSKDLTRHSQSSENRPLATGNEAIRKREYANAISSYGKFLLLAPQLSKVVAPNIARTRQLYRSKRNDASKIHVGVCGWDLAHNAAGRVHTLAALYEKFADVEMIGCLNSDIGREIWPPLRKSTIPVRAITIENWCHFIDQAIEFVASNPYDIVHLSKPRAPNILFGILYKLFWEAKILVDVDDEELAFVGEQTSVSINQYLQSHKNLPQLENLISPDWTRLAVGFVHDFDGVTVSNSALQARYGGDIVQHAREEDRYCPSVQLKINSRAKFDIPENKKVVLFFGTPRAHKGLLETTNAIARLRRDDIIFVIVGDFPDPDLRRQLEAVSEVNFLFLGNQPFELVPEVVAIADICVLLQDNNSFAARFQIPAKLSDALAMGVPVIATKTPALADVFASDAAAPTTEHDLSTNLELLINDQNAWQLLSKSGRKYFEAALSFAYNVSELKRSADVSIAKSLSDPLCNLIKALGDTRLAALV